MSDFNRQEIHQDFEEFFPVQADVEKRSVSIPAAKLLAAIASVAVTAALVFNTYVDCFATQIWQNSALLNIRISNLQEYQDVTWQLTEQDGEFVRQGQLDVGQTELPLENLDPDTKYIITFTTQEEGETKILGDYHFTTGAPSGAGPSGPPVPDGPPTPAVTQPPAPTSRPTAEPTATPAVTATPTPVPVLPAVPTAAPTSRPTAEPTVAPTATPAPAVYTVTVSTSGGGTVTADPASAEAGMIVMLMATADRDYRFAGWQQTSGPEVVITNGSFTMPEGDVEFTAAFEKLIQEPQALDTVVNDIIVEEVSPEETTRPVVDIDVDFMFQLNSAQLVDITVEHAMYSTYDDSVITRYDAVDTAPVTDENMIAKANHIFTITEGMYEYYKYVATPLLTYTMQDGNQYTLEGNSFVFQLSHFNQKDYSSSSITYNVTENADGTKTLDYTLNISPEDIMGNAADMRITELTGAFDNMEIEIPADALPLAPGVMTYSGSLLLTGDMLVSDTHTISFGITGQSCTALSDGTVKDLGYESYLYVYNDEVRTNSGGYTLIASLPADNPANEGVSITDVQVSVNGGNFSDSLQNVVLSPDAENTVYIRYTIGSNNGTMPDAYYYPQIGPANGATDFYCNVTQDSPYHIDDTKFEVSFVLPAITVPEGETIDLSQYVDYTGLQYVYNRYIIADGYLQSAGSSWRDIYVPQGENFALTDYLEVTEVQVGDEYIEIQVGDECIVEIYNRSYDAEWNAIDTLLAQYQTAAVEGTGNPLLAINYSETPVERLNREIYITYRLII